MTLQFQSLSEGLRPTARAVADYFSQREGTRAFRAEAEIAPDIHYRPTLLGDSRDKSLLAVEVTEGSYTIVLDQFVADCMTRGLAVKLYLAVQKGAPSTEWQALYRQTKQRGIGLLEVDGETITLELAALPLGLSGLRPIDLKIFPKVCRADLVQAENTFRSGSPAKGCSELYDVIEHYSRRVARKIGKLGLWRKGMVPPSHADPWYETTAWARVLGEVADNVDFAKLSRSVVRIDRALWGSIVALTPDRNDSGHRPSNRRKLETRNARLRTRFEHATDELAKLVAAAGRAVRPQ